MKMVCHLSGIKLTLSLNFHCFNTNVKGFLFFIHYINQPVYFVNSELKLRWQH